MAERTPLSRLEADFFTKNLHYATNWQCEHASNFRKFLTDLILPDTLQKICENASTLCMKFNEKIGWISADYNADTIKYTYAKLQEKLKENCGLLADLAEAYFQIYTQQLETLSKEPARNELKEIKVFWARPNLKTDAADTILKGIMGDKFTEEGMRQNFYPQLLLFYLRIFDVYDRSIQGMTVSQCINKIKNPSPPPPKSKEEELIRDMGKEIGDLFGSKEFWDKRYSGLKTGSNVLTYDWYVDYSAVLPVLEKYVPCCKEDVKAKRDSLKILNVGCGNSLMSEEMWADGFKDSVNIDFVGSVITYMQERAIDKDIKGCKYFMMDIKKLDEKVAPKGGFDLVIDKGTLDAIFCTPASLENLDIALTAVSSALKKDGYCIIVSCAFNSERIRLLTQKQYNWELVSTTELASRDRQETQIFAIVFKCTRE
mmetsp:Transcript_21837/g.24377  ORF Transcript_21837/g.24377 Transcript_21837/m.24377 type:complete len:429 (+) Transcript_21837:37-1323(+)